MAASVSKRRTSVQWLYGLPGPANAVPKEDNIIA